MSFLSNLISSLFGRGDAFAGLDPEDLTMFWRIEHDLDQVDRDEQDLKTVLAKYNVSSRSKLENAMGAYGQLHSHKPEFAQAARDFHLKVQMGNMASYHPEMAQ